MRLAGVRDDFSQPQAYMTHLHFQKQSVQLLSYEKVSQTGVHFEWSHQDFYKCKDCAFD